MVTRSNGSLRAVALVMGLALGAASCGGGDDVFGNLSGAGGAAGSGTEASAGSQGAVSGAGGQGTAVGAGGQGTAASAGAGTGGVASTSTSSAGGSMSTSSTSAAVTSSATSGSATASASAGSGGGGPCAPAPTDSTCDTCIKTSCCSLLTACKSEPTCACWFDCMDMTMFDYFYCGTTCGFPNGTSSMLFDCINASCGAPCPP